MERVSLWQQLKEPATTKDWFLVCFCMTIGFWLGAAYATAAAFIALKG